MASTNLSRSRRARTRGLGGKELAAIADYCGITEEEVLAEAVNYHPIEIMVEAANRKARSRGGDLPAAREGTAGE